MFRRVPRFTTNLTLSCCLIVALGIAAWAQRTTGSIGGVVQDSTGGVLPNAEVEVTNVDTTITNRTQSNEVGIFLFPALQPGRYRLRVSAPGFNTAEQPDIILESARDVRGTYPLQVGEVSQTITVEAQAALVSTVSAEQRAGLENRQLAELPVLNRNISSLLSLSAGVQQGGVGGNRAIRLSGLGAQATSYAVDGVEASGQADGRQLSAYGGNNRVDLLGAEAIQEVQIIKGVIPAEFNNTLAGQVNIITKSGTSKLHGSLFHLYQPSVLAARDPFTPATSAKPKVVYNQFGGSLGFPIFQNRNVLGFINNAFGYFTYEGYREVRNQVRMNNNVPTQLARNVLLSSPFYNARERNLMTTALSTQPLPTEPITDTQTCNACGGQRGLTGRVITVRPDLRDDNTFLFKGDLHLKDGSVLALSWSKMDPFSRNANAVPSNEQLFDDHSRRYGANWFKSTGMWSFDVRGGYTWNEQERTTEAVCLLDPNAPATTIPFDTMTASYGATNVFTSPVPEIRFVWSPIYNLQGKVGYLRGSHNFKWGTNFRHQAGGFSNPEGAQHRHEGSTNSAGINSAFENLYNNAPPTTLRVALAQPNHDFPYRQFGLFVQDDWKVRSNFTLNLGLRYDYLGAPRLLSSKYDKYPTSPEQILVLFNLQPFTDIATRNFGNPMYTEQLANDNLNFAPRVGFNWDVWGQGKTVIRGGFAQMFSVVTQDPIRDMIMDGIYPRFLLMTNAENTRFGITAQTLTVDARTAVRTLIRERGATPVGTLADPDMRAPYAMNWTFGFQQSLSTNSLLEMDYVVTRGVHLPLQQRFNQPDRTTGLTPNPTLIGDFYMDDSQQSFYNGLQVSYRRRFAAGLLYNFNYTFGKSLATSGGDIGNGRAASDNSLCCQDFFALAAERGRIPSDIRHDFNSSWVYDIPSVPGFMRHVFGGFTLSGIVRVRSGQPMTFSQGAGGRGIQRPDILVDDYADARVPGNYRETRQYLDRTKFAIVPNGVRPASLGGGSSGQPARPGNTGRGIIEGPGSWTTDFSLARNFQITEGMRLQFRWDAINALNRVNYSNPTTAVNNNNFGLIQAAGPMRQQQINLKLLF
ncbi:MAG: carboxypeptidase regulatory-like domain-containing protein [Candidatus Korobacteraceae bacterium]